jgi:anhydro-N-acetylmuramic acid kinase
MTLYLGLMSGTSLDGVDAVLARFEADAPPQVLAHSHLEMPPALAAELLALNAPGDNELHRAALAANALMHLYAGAASLACRHAGVATREVDAIGAHGQTLRHQPGRHDGTGYTLQLAHGALLAELTGIDVVCDFRSRDVAAGGQGAPLVPAFHAAMFAEPGRTIVVLNLGGIANVTVLAADGSVSGHDTGPANLLLDHWIREQRGEPFDRDGAWAASGRVDTALLQRLFAEPYFSLPPPKSTGRDLFNADWLQLHLAAAARCSGADVMATLTELTAVSAAEAVRAAAAERLLVCGGGAANGTLMRRFAALLPGLPIDSTAAAGVPPQQIEALAFAWLARAFRDNRCGNLPAVTGARGPRVLGALYPAGPRQQPGKEYGR